MNADQLAPNADCRQKVELLRAKNLLIWNSMQIKKKFKQTWGFLDTWIFRWVSTVFTTITVILACFLDIDVSLLRDRYPHWHGAMDLLEGISLYENLLGCAVISFVGAAYNTFRSGSISKLVKKNLELDQDIGKIAENIHVLFENVLFSLATKLELDDAGNERVSIYVHMSEESAFVPCGRYSHNPELKKKGRTSFATNQGCIERAWHDGWHFANDFPEDRSGTGYRDHMLKTYNIPRNTTRKMKMHPLAIGAKRIQVGTTPIGVIVVESSNRHAFDETELKQKLDENADDFGRMISAIKSYIPDPKRAEEVGL
jgi:hypothetical protein